jgi:hypothetical protein
MKRVRSRITVVVIEVALATVAEELKEGEEVGQKEDYIS